MSAMRRRLGMVGCRSAECGRRYSIAGRQVMILTDDRVLISGDYGPDVGDYPVSRAR